MEASPSKTPRSEVAISWQELHMDARTLARRLDRAAEWQGIVAITRGGLVPAALLARELDIRLIDTVCVVSYRAGQSGADARVQGELNWLKGAQGVGGDGRGWLLVDDLVDTGRTAQAVRDRLPHAYFATLYAKPLGRPHVDTCVREFAQDEWIYFPWDTDGRDFVAPIRERGR